MRQVAPRVFRPFMCWWLVFIFSVFFEGGSMNGLASDVGGQSQYFSFPETIGPFRLQGAEETYGPENLFDYMDGAAELYLAYNFRRMRVARYSKGNGPPITAELYEMPTSEDAFGVFSLEREDDEAFIGQGSEIGGGILKFWKGRFFAIVYGESQVSNQDLLAIGGSIAQAIGEEGPQPHLLRLLPKDSEGLIPTSVRFFRTHTCLNKRFFVANQNILLLGPDRNGIVAQVAGSKGKVHLVLVEYPTEKDAIEAQKSFAQAYMWDSLDKGRIKTEDGKWTGATRKGTLWVGVFGAGSEEELDSFIERVISRAGS